MPCAPAIKKLCSRGIRSVVVRDSFKTSFQHCLQNARTVIFEGPLDSDSMAAVVEAGFDRQEKLSSI
jgi:hypothetical protein